MDSQELMIRPFVAGDEERVNQAFNQVFGRRRTLAEWGWKFPIAPDGRPIMLGTLGDEVVTQYASIEAPFQVDGRVVLAAQIVDAYAVAKARGTLVRRNFWVRTVEAFFSTFCEHGHIAMLFGFPGQRHLRLGLLQLGYGSVEPQAIVYLRRTCTQKWNSVRRAPYRAQLARDWEPCVDTLWSRVRHSYPVAAVRDAERMLRRLAGHPTVYYHRFVVFPRFSTQPVAYAAFRIDGGRCRWLELVWDHDHPGALTLLSHLSARLAHQASAGVEELWLNGDPPGLELLCSLGFELMPEPNELVLVARSFDNQLDVTRLDQRVYLTMADADLE